MTADLILDEPPPDPMDPPEALFPPEPAIPLLPGIMLRPGYPRPLVLDVRRDTRIGQIVCQVDASDPELPTLAPGTYWVCARWPSGHGQARAYEGGWKKYRSEAAAPPQQGLPLELAKAIGDLAAAQQGNAQALQQIAGRLERLETRPATVATAAAAPIGGMTMMETVMIKLMDRALAPAPAPAPPPDPLASMRAFFELQKSFREAQPAPAATPAEGGGSTTAQIVAGFVDAARDAIDAIPEAAERVAKARAMQGLELLDPTTLLRQIPAIPDQTLAAWLARALECGLIHRDVVGGGGEAEGDEAAQLMGDVLRFSPTGKARLRAVVTGAMRLLATGDGDGEKERGTSAEVSGAGAPAGQLTPGGAGAGSGGGAPPAPT